MLMIFAASLPVMGLGVFAERLFRAKPCPIRALTFNLLCLVPFAVLRVVAVNSVMGGTVTVVNKLGAGIICLPSEGYLLIPAIVAYTLAMDFAEYIFHRAQHRLPALWAMHSFHHSDESLNVTTTFRHFWAEQAIKTCTIYLLIGLLFRTNVRIIAVYSAISLLNYFFHMNVRVGFGRGWFLLNSPQYHRVHHSSLMQHHDKNFAALFPILDAIFGTAYRPQPDEYPPTGLHDQNGPRSIFEAIVWPARRLIFIAIGVRLRSSRDSA
jgi:sterol desaturase/sphingolipid hydroxylase (fatty acid hydroxylase superfamily)